MRPLSEDEARAFLETAKASDDRFEPLYVLAITTGLRRGELLGLRWDDADLERGKPRVGRALVREGGRHTVWENPATERRSTVPRHRELPRGTARAICDQLGVQRVS